MLEQKYMSAYSSSINSMIPTAVLTIDAAIPTVKIAAVDTNNQATIEKACSGPILNTSKLLPTTAKMGIVIVRLIPSRCRTS